jgi:hypothetical protein
MKSFNNEELDILGIFGALKKHENSPKRVLFSHVIKNYLALLRQVPFIYTTKTSIINESKSSVLVPS